MYKAVISIYILYSAIKVCLTEAQPALNSNEIKTTYQSSQ